jgi:hypothetical protein
MLTLAPARIPPLHAQAARLLADPEEDGWERTDFPVVCEDCLGPNPYIRMQKVRATPSTLNPKPRGHNPDPCKRPSPERYAQPSKHPKL